MSASVPLLAAKLCIPPSVSNLVPRPQLLKKLNEGLGSGRRATLVSAPAGYGKTTLLSHWAHQCGRAVAWLSLDDDDSDPARFLAYLEAALRRAGVAPAGAMPGAGAWLASPSARATVASVIGAVDTASRPFVLVLDDYHLIQGSPVHDAVAYLLDHLPAQAHLVIASRADPPLALARLRAHGQLTEVRQRDLRLSEDEATAFLNHVMGLGMEPGDVNALAARTEGWIAGLRLAAISLQAHGDVHRFVQDFGGSNRYVLDYLMEEVVRRQPPAIQAFLLQTSILERLSGPLCDAVVANDAEEPTQTSGQEMLERLENRNLFVVPLDEERHWYRYHRLFADLLQKRLRETSPQLVPLLHARAAAWHEQHGMIAEAIDHALAGQDVERAAQLIEAYAEATLMRSESMTLLRWINALPETQVRARPALSVYHAWVLLLSGSSLETVEEILRHLEQSDPLRLPVAALIAHYRGDPARAIELGRDALARLPEAAVFLRGLAALALATAHHTRGDFASSRRILEEAALAAHPADGPGNDMIVVSAACYQAEMSRREGSLRRANDLYTQALDLATDGATGARLPIAGRALLGLAEIAREWNDLDQATRHAMESIELSGRWGQPGMLEAYLIVARIRCAREDWSGVDAALRTMRQLAQNFKATEIDDRLADMAEAWMQIARGELEGPRRWAARYALAGDADPRQLEASDSSVGRRLRKYEYPIAARLWLAEGRPAWSIALLARALPLVQDIKRAGLVIEYLIQMALAAKALRQDRKAIGALEQALTLAEPEGFLRIFLDEGKELARLLYQAAGRGISPAYVGHLLAAFPQEGDRSAAERRWEAPGKASAQPSPALVEPLSERELEVLRLIAAGLSNDEIARKLVLSLATVKWHTTHIYDKLSVKNRTEAVARARGLGLLPTT